MTEAKGPSVGPSAPSNTVWGALVPLLGEAIGPAITLLVTATLVAAKPTDMTQAVVLSILLPVSCFSTAVAFIAASRNLARRVASAASARNAPPESQIAVAGSSGEKERP